MYVGNWCMVRRKQRVDFVAWGCLKVPFFIFSKVPLHLHTFNQTAVGQFKSLLQKYLFP